MTNRSTHDSGTEHETTGLAAIEAARSDLEALAARDDLKCSKYAEALLAIADEEGDTRG